MMQTEAIVKSLDDVLALGQKLKGYDWKKPLVFTWKPYSKQRSLPMNSLSHIWYADISKHTGETEADVKAECKLTLGVPILRAEDDAFRLFYDKAIKNIFTYEEKLEAIKFVPVTSRMNKDQMARYLTNMQHTYARAGVILESTGEYEQWLKQESANHD